MNIKRIKYFSGFLILLCFTSFLWFICLKQAVTSSVIIEGRILHFECSENTEYEGVFDYVVTLQNRITYYNEGPIHCDKIATLQKNALVNVTVRDYRLLQLKTEDEVVLSYSFLNGEEDKESTVLWLLAITMTFLLIRVWLQAQKAWRLGDK